MEWCCRMRPVQPNHLHQPLYLQGRDRSQPSNKLSKQKRARYLACAGYRVVNSDADVACIIDSVNAANIKIGRTNKILPKNFPYFCGDFFAQNRKKAAKLPEEGSLAACPVPKSLPKPPENGGDSNGKSLRSAGSKTSYFDDTAIKNWPTVKSANQYGCGDRT